MVQLPETIFGRNYLAGEIFTSDYLAKIWSILVILTKFFLYSGLDKESVESKSVRRRVIESLLKIYTSRITYNI